MPAADFQSSAPFSFATRTILSFRRDNNSSHPVMDGNHESGMDQRELAAFQRQIADLFHDLVDGGEDSDEILSIAWVRRLLDTFLLCQEEFRVILFSHHRPPTPQDRLVADFFERAVKALDVCNAVRDGVEQLRVWRTHLEIVVTALGPQQRALGDGQIRRAKKALAEIAVLMLDDKDPGSVASHRNSCTSTSLSSGRSAHFRSLSWSVSKSWSAAKQLQAIGSNLGAPRGQEALPVYTMSSVLLFVMWALVAAIPCQDRGLHIHFSIPRNYVWAAPIMSLHETILEESKKKDRKNSIGLLKEIHQTEKCVQNLIELLDSNAQLPMTKEKEAEVREAVKELAQVCDAMKEGLDPLDRQIREIFLRIVRSRAEGLDSSLHGAE
ncbi:hypothetical protein Cni_G21492 [Canna indica]|uniref:Uncharacterized protein n=1 Tax=Canna indica TaxID=4628 RepID=A0AAQ3KQX4_9LILI|nr:hypothetical protein Cni_G21492 [Canna indica]